VSKRFEDLKKVPKEPAMRLMALANMKFQSPLATPANASVPDVFAVLNKGEDRIAACMDMLRLMAASLPARERTWWACLAGHDMLPDPKQIPGPLAAAEAWVRKPNDENREAIRVAMETAESDDDTSLAAVAAIFADGTLGPGDLKAHPAPAGASHGAAFGMNALALSVAGIGFEDAAQHLIDRGLDLARGGNGKPSPLVSFKPDEPSEPAQEAIVEETAP